MTAEAAADLAWASANTAALLYVTARLQVPARLQEPDPAVTDTLRDRAMQIICKPRPKVKRA
jgi:hypothetical protein